MGAEYDGLRTFKFDPLHLYVGQRTRKVIAEMDRDYTIVYIIMTTRAIGPTANVRPIIVIELPGAWGCD